MSLKTPADFDSQKSSELAPFLQDSALTLSPFSSHCPAMCQRFLALVLLAALAAPLAACSTVQIAAPAGGSAKLAAVDSGKCKVVGEKRVQTGFWGTVSADKSVADIVPEGKNVRILARRDGLDGFLSWLGYAFTFGLYSGSQQFTVEVCED